MSLSPDAVSPEAVVVSEDVVVAVESALFVVPVVPVLSEPPVPVSVETVVVVSENEVLPPADESEVAVVAPVVSVVDVVAVSVAVMSVETVVPDAVVPVGSVVPVTSLTLLPESEDVPASSTLYLMFWMLVVLPVMMWKLALRHLPATPTGETSLLRGSLSTIKVWGKMCMISSPGCIMMLIFGLLIG